MAPSATESVAQVDIPVHSVKATTTKPWVKATGVLDQYESFDVTPVIGREFPHANLVEWLKSPNADELLRELALTSKHLTLDKSGSANNSKFHKEELYSSASKTTSQQTSKKNSSNKSGF
jgi:thioester reductase-like protein